MSLWHVCARVCGASHATGKSSRQHWVAYGSPVVGGSERMCSENGIRVGHCQSTSFHQTS